MILRLKIGSSGTIRIFNRKESDRATQMKWSDKGEWAWYRQAATSDITSRYECSYQLYSNHFTCPLPSLFGSSLSTSPLSFSYHILCCLKSHIITDQRNVLGHAITFKMPHHISLQHTTPSHTTPQHTTGHTYLRHCSCHWEPMRSPEIGRRSPRSSPWVSSQTQLVSSYGRHI